VRTNAARGIITATKRARARARAARWMAMAGKRARATVARGMAMATSRVAGDERQGGDGGNGPWFVCVFLCVWRDHKK
jgi:hypothetical protein